MKKLILITILLLLSVGKGFSQDIEKLKESDTIFVKFDSGDGQKKMVRKSPKNEPVAEQFYVYCGENPNAFMLFDYNLIDKQAIPYSRKAIERIRKSQTLTAKEMSLLPVREASKIFGGRKTIYLIDVSGNDKSKYSIKRVEVISSELFEM